MKYLPTYSLSEFSENNKTNLKCGQIPNYEAEATLLRILLVDPMRIYKILM